MKNYARLSEGLKLYRDTMRSFVGITLRKQFSQGDWFADRVLPNVTPQQMDSLQRDPCETKAKWPTRRTSRGSRFEGHLALFC